MQYHCMDFYFMSILMHKEDNCVGYFVFRLADEVNTEPEDSPSQFGDLFPVTVCDPSINSPSFPSCLPCSFCCFLSLSMKCWHCEGIWSWASLEEWWQSSLL